MTFDLPGLVRQMSRLMLAGAAICALVALITFLLSRSDGPDRRQDAVIVLGALSAVQAAWWFGLTVWVDLAEQRT